MGTKFSGFLTISCKIPLSTVQLTQQYPCGKRRNRGFCSDTMRRSEQGLFFISITGGFADEKINSKAGDTKPALPAYRSLAVHISDDRGMFRSRFISGGFTDFEQIEAEY